MPAQRQIPEHDEAVDRDARLNAHEHALSAVAELPAGRLLPIVHDEAVVLAELARVAWQPAAAQIRRAGAERKTLRRPERARDQRAVGELPSAHGGIVRVAW